MNDENPPCNNPNCGSTEGITKAGVQTYRTGRHQMYKCNECGRRFKGELIKAVTV